MQTVPAAPLGKTASVAENAPHLGSTERSRHLIDISVARRSFAACKLPSPERFGTLFRKLLSVSSP